MTDNTRIQRRTPALILPQTRQRRINHYIREIELSDRIGQSRTWGTYYKELALENYRKLKELGFGAVYTDKI